MFYTIYKITNLVNRKYYIGKHQTKNLDDGYMGSGKLLKLAISKYGISNFKKEILHIFDTEHEMNAKEKELVVVNESTYNLNEGGKGGFSHINSTMTGKQKKIDRAIEKWQTLYKTDPEWRDRKRDIMKTVNSDPERRKKISTTKKAYFANNPGFFNGQKHTPETITRLKETRKGTGQGEANSQFATCWVTNELINYKIKCDELNNWLSNGFRKGRVLKMRPH